MSAGRGHPDTSQPATTGPGGAASRADAAGRVVTLDPSMVSGPDREFLPAALEIIETPPAPRQTAFLLGICLFAAAALSWSILGQVDVHAIAWGKIETSGRAKVVQPLEAGKISAINVVDGAEVKVGDVLIELDATEALADATAATQAFASYRAEMARRRAVIDTVHALMEGRASPHPVRFDTHSTVLMREREQAVYDADVRQFSEVLNSIDKQVNQRNATRQRLTMSIDFQTKLLQTLEDRVNMRESSLKLSVGTKIGLFDAQEALHKSQSQLASDRGQLIENDASIEELKSQKSKQLSIFVAENETRLAEASRKADEAAQQIIKAQSKLARTKLIAPIDGTIQQIAATTIGQVVSTGQQLLTVSPRGGALQIEIFVSNIDIGFVHVGQPAAIKIDAFPFTRYGTVDAVVSQIASDAIDEQEAKRRQSSAITAASAPVAAVAPGQLQQFVFPVRLELKSTAVPVAGRPVPLMPGMTVMAEIQTDKRRIIDYLLSPIAKTTSEALHER